ncbi:uncharacterized protein [Choristoneura fumiferana]|uniref:uncharacterized protein n=1 Tax=Choristoneura fumiferana TaxID=7141 RepID=UPI003D15CE7A
MIGDEGGGDSPPVIKARKRASVPEENGEGSNEDDLYLPYLKPNYKRLYPENSLNVEFKVFIESKDNKEKLGNKSPIYLNHIFAAEVKGVVAIRRINANKITAIFKQYNTANNFLNNTKFMEKYNMKAYIPAAQIERTGIIRYVPQNISNKELYSKLSSSFDIVAVRRFTKKVGQNRVPLQTVSITFLSNTLPDSVQYDLFSYRVFDYVPPLQQCYRCFKFNHSAKVCNGKQRCSCCSGEHSYKDCDKPTELCCINCGGAHLAISKMCPIKMRKIQEKKTKITYASVTDSKRDEFPPLIQKPISKQPQDTTINNNSKNLASTGSPSKIVDLKNLLMTNNDLTMTIVRTLIAIANKADDSPVTTKSIKDLLFKNLP